MKPRLIQETNTFQLWQHREHCNQFERKAIVEIMTNLFSEITLGGELSFMHACSTVRNICDERMKMNKLQHNVVGCTDPLVTFEPEMRIFSLTKGTEDCWIKLTKKEKGTA
jgi:hypothetical protein